MIKKENYRRKTMKCEINKSSHIEIEYEFYFCFFCET